MSEQQTEQRTHKRFFVSLKSFLKSSFNCFLKKGSIKCHNKYKKGLEKDDLKRLFVETE